MPDKTRTNEIEPHVKMEKPGCDRPPFSGLGGINRLLIGESRCHMSATRLS